MRKLLALFAVIAVCTALTACEEKLADNEPQQKVEYDTPVKTVTLERTIDLSDGISENGENFSCYCDLDGDGNDEKVAIDIVGSDDGQAIEVAMGEKFAVLDLYDGYIEKVYSCDIDITDGVRDIAIITEEISGDPRIRILNYAEEITPWLFKDAELGEISDSRWLGYASSFYFNVNDDDTIALEEQTRSVGMWSVLRNFRLGEDGVFEEIPQDMYAILPDFMANADYFEEGTEPEEIEMWKKGYIKAHVEVSNGNITVKEGEYIKPVYDDDRNRLYIEKQSGEQGYIELSYDAFENRHEFNNAFFFLAG